MAEPSLGQVRDEMLAGLALDQRVRGVEIEQATMKAEVAGLRHEVRSMKTDLLAAIAETKPKPIWPAVSALCAVMIVLMGVFASIYGGR